MPATHPLYAKLIAQHLKILENLQYRSGLFAASKKDAHTGYDKAWLRDNFYECLAFEVLGDLETVRKTSTNIGRNGATSKMIPSVAFSSKLASWKKDKREC